jgi:alkanesulfonate monooxygenase SsuD/methylene tetrahydromethanopterin reductase-like flavin-dependent oxidoreductase (luciferase family)
VFSLRFDMRLGDVDARTAYAATLDMVEWAEAPLAPVVVLSEHHGVEGGYLPSPGPLAAAMAARTTSTFIMVAATLLPLHDPVRLAEDIAVIDHLSGGRVGWVFGLGYRPEEFALLDVEWAGRGRRMDHHLRVVLDALDGLDLTTHGRPGSVRPAVVPRPQLFVGGGSGHAARRAARFGLGLFAQTDAGGLGDLYAAECERLGVEPRMCVLPPPDLPLSVFVADDVDAAWDEIGPYLLSNAIDYAGWNPGSTTTASLSQASTVDELRADLGAYRIVTVDEAVAMATSGSLSLHPMCGGIPPEVAWPYLRRVADEVAPALPAPA